MMILMRRWLKNRKPDCSGQSHETVLLINRTNSEKSHFALAKDATSQWKLSEKQPKTINKYSPPKGIAS